MADVSTCDNWGVLVGRTGVGLGARGTRLLESQRTVVAKNVIPFR